jgi:hypothetical protein
MSALPSDFWMAIKLLAKASGEYRKATGRSVVLVGGAAVSFYAQGAVLSGDFDMVADIAFEPFLLTQGFQRENRPGRLRRGYYHLDVPRYGFEFVSGALFDGRSDREKNLSVAVTDDADIVLASIEDLIADRLAQYASSKNRDLKMLEQARILLALAVDYDPIYLFRRITEEGGDPAALRVNDANG